MPLPGASATQNKCMCVCMDYVENGYVTNISNAILCGMCKRKSISHTNIQTKLVQIRANALHLFLLTSTYTHTTKASLVWVWLTLRILDYSEYQDIFFQTLIVQQSREELKKKPLARSFKFLFSSHFLSLCFVFSFSDIL